MARLRFPGRPGHRFDRISVRFFADDVKNLHDPSLEFLPQFKRGLNAFRELVGLSDEEDDFDGFTAGELAESEHKLAALIQHEEKEAKDIKVSPPQPRGKRARQSHSKSATKEKLEMPIVPKTVVTKAGVTKIKPSKFKRSSKIEAGCHAPKKKTEMDMAKFLLEKARQANLLQEQARAKKLTSPKHAAVQKKEFVLPKQSSRSSRVIKPNKRFLEEEATAPCVRKILKAEKTASSLTSPLPVKVKDRSFSVDGSPIASLVQFADPSVGLLDQPLIVKGKRDRKPSLKLKLSDDDSLVMSPDKSPVMSPLAAPKLGTSLFQQSQFHKASDKAKFGMLGLGSGRKHGTSIVQKAKLQLNRAALNKSKAALAKALKAEMKQEAKYADQDSDQDDVVQPTTLTSADRKKLKRQLLKKFNKKCSVCGNKKELMLCFNALVCYNCKRFFVDFRRIAESGIFVRPACKTGTGKCSVIKVGTTVPCRDCRFRKCLEMGMPAEGQLRAAYGLRKKAATVAVAQTYTASDSDDNHDRASPGKVQRTQKTYSSLHSPTSSDEYAFISPQALLKKQKASEQELSPLKTSEGSARKYRKRRAFKELLQSKQEKHEAGVIDLEDIEDLPPAPAPVVMEVQEGSVEISPRSSGAGPRIKHVCRNAAVALGRPLATFPEKSELRLSALPNVEKYQLWKKDEDEKAEETDSDDDRPMDEIIQQSADSVVIMKKTPTKFKVGGKKLTGAGGLHLYKRKIRCKQCPGCKATECGRCRHCLDKPKFGGPGVLKQGCMNRRCTNPLIKRSATEAFIEEKPRVVTREKTRERSASPLVEARVPGVSFQPHQSTSTEDLQGAVPGPHSIAQSILGLHTQTGTLVSDQTQTQSTHCKNGNCNERTVNQSREMAVYHSQSAGSTRSSAPVATSQGSGEVRKLVFDDFQLEKVGGTRKTGKLPAKLMKNLELNQKYTKEGGNDGQCYPVTLQSVNPASRQWGSLLSQPRYYPVRVDFKTSCDINVAWRYGMAVTMSSAMSVRTLCFLCSSAGKHEMIYCNICCEPYHEFCLEDGEQPTTDNDNDWICPACQFCHVCGHQNNLLQCDKCQNTYHPGCLGPNYPTKPSKRKRIWICTKCVKCKSCGATTPGTGAEATWTYDFSLCHECGLLMDKGNFCPICKKCYSDDDWESKMVQCNKCESWVHSKCEGLTDEMYEILSYLPEDLSFYCRKCHPVGCPEWESTLKRELMQGLQNILHTLIIAKSAKYILKHDEESSPVRRSPKKNSQLLDNQTETSEVKQENHDICDKKDEESKVGGNSNCDTECGSSNWPLSGGQQHLQQHIPCNALQSASIESTNTLEDSSAVGHVCNGPGPIGDSKQCDDSSSKLEQNGCVSRSLSVNTDNQKRACDKNEGPSVQPDCAGDSQQTIISDNQSESGSGRRTTRSAAAGRTNKLVNGDIICDTMKSKSSVFQTNVQTGDNSSNNADATTTSTSTSGNVNNKIGCHTGDHFNTGCEGGVKTEMKMQTGECSEQSVNESNKLMVNGNTVGDDISKLSRTDKDASKVQHHVHFLEAVTDSTKVVANIDSPVKEEDDGSPKDLMEIASKMKEGNYKSVAIFCEDILRVIQAYLDKDGETETRKKSIDTARSVFVKQLGLIFPWFNVKTCRHWYSSKALPQGMLADATLPPNADHTYAQWLERIELPRSPQPSPYKKRMATPVKKYIPTDEDDVDMCQLLEGEDERLCMFCKTFGDQDVNEAGRLVYCGQDDWCHVNCALWSAEVYESAEGSLMNLVEAFSRAKLLRCDLCGKKGATVGCNTRGCKANYHFMCARRDLCKLQEDKKVFCKDHWKNVDGELLGPDRFNVLRRVYVETLNVRSVKKSWAKGINVTDINVLMGSCCVEGIGRLTDLSDKPKFLHPVDFVASRMYWSTKDARRRCVYTCRIIEVRPEAMLSPTIGIRDMTTAHTTTYPGLNQSIAHATTYPGLNQSIALATMYPGTDQSMTHVSKYPGVPGQSTDNSLAVSASAFSVSVKSQLQPSSIIDLTGQEESMDTGQVVSLDDRKAVVDRKVIDTVQLDKTWKSMGGNVVKSASLNNSVSHTKPAPDPDRLSSSWPLTARKQSVMDTANLSYLSPNTLKMLNIKDPTKYMKPIQQDSPTTQNKDDDDDGLNLLAIAKRLNTAAAKHSRQPNGDSPSPRNSLSPGTVRPFSPVCAPRQRSHSVERMSSPTVFPSRSYAMSTFLKSLPEKSFTPPSRMHARSRSLSIEKESKVVANSSFLRVENSEPFLPVVKEESAAVLRRGRSVSDPLSLTPKPIGFSSPVTDRRHTHLISDINTLSDMNTTDTALDSTSDDAGNLTNLAASSIENNQSQTQGDSSLMETSCSASVEPHSPGTTQTIGETGDNDGSTGMEISVDSETISIDSEQNSETIVVMTESGESLSDEDAIRIVQEVLERSISLSMEQAGGTEQANETACGTEEAGDGNVQEEMENDATPGDRDVDAGVDINAEDAVDSKAECEEDNIEQECEADNIKQDCEGDTIQEDAVPSPQGSVTQDKTDTHFEHETKQDRTGLIGNVLDDLVDNVEQSEKQDNADIVADKVNTEKPASPFIPKMCDNDNNPPAHNLKLRGGKLTRVKLVSSAATTSNFPFQARKLSNVTTSISSPIVNGIEPLDEIRGNLVEAASKVVGGDLSEVNNSVNSHTVLSVVANPAALKEEITEKSATLKEATTEKNDIFKEVITDKTAALKEVTTLALKEATTEKSAALHDVKEDSNASTEMEVLVIDPDSDTSRDSDIIDISDSVNLSVKDTCEHEDTRSEPVWPDTRSQPVLPDTRSEPVLPRQDQDGDKCIKPVVYDLDESIDSDIELLEDIGAVKSNDAVKEPMQSCESPCTTQEAEKDEVDGDRKVMMPQLQANDGDINKGNADAVLLLDSNGSTVDAEKNCIENDDESGIPESKTDQEDCTDVAVVDVAVTSVGCSSELPVLDQISKKIKEESIAKSCPGDKGPFKCANCRRMYRTDSSYKIHIENCTFCVSSSEDDSNSQDSVKTVERLEMRVTRSRRKEGDDASSTADEGRTESLVEKKDSQDQGVESEDTAVAVPQNDVGLGKVRSSLRQSTVCQRLAQQAEALQAKMGSQVEEVQSVDDDDDSRDGDVPQNGSQKVRSSLRQSTVCQRLAQEAEAKRLKEEAKKLKEEAKPLKQESAKRSKDRLSFNKNADNVQPDSNKKSEIEAKTGECSGSDAKFSGGHDETPKQLPNLRTKLRKSDSVESIHPTEAETSDSEKKEISPIVPRVTRSKCQSVTSESQSESSDLEVENIAKERIKLADLVNKRRSHGKRSLSKEEVKSADEDDDRLRSPEAKRKSFNVELYKSCSDDDNDTCNDSKEREAVEKETHKKKGRGWSRRKKGRKSANRGKTKHGTNIVGKHTNVELSVTDENENIQNESMDSQESSDDGEVLDPETGFIVDKKTGEVCGNPNSTEVGEDVSGQVEQGINQGCDQANICNTEESSDSRNQLIGKGTNDNQGFGNVLEVSVEGAKASSSSEGHEPMETEDVEEIDLTLSASEDDTDGNTPETSNNMTTITGDSVNQADQMQVNDTGKSGGAIEERKAAAGDNTVSESDTFSELAASPGTLPEAVLKLLKDGHRVVIRNPKLNKNFLWQKTKDGYMGRPFNKEVPIKSPDKETKNLPESSPGVDNAKNDKTKVAETKRPVTDSLIASQLNSKPMSASEIAFKSNKTRNTLRQQIENRNQLLQLTNQLLQPTLNETAVQNNVQTQKNMEITSQLVAQNIKHLIQQNNRERLLDKGQASSHALAEYVGGVVIQSQPLTDMKQMIERTAPLATYTLQNTLPVHVQQTPQHLQGQVQVPGMIPTMISPPQTHYPLIPAQAQQHLTTVGFSAALPNTGITSLFQTGYGNYATGGVGIQGLQAVNQATSLQCIAPPQASTAMSQLPVLDMGMVTLPMPQIQMASPHAQPIPCQQNTMAGYTQMVSPGTVTEQRNAATNSVYNLQNIPQTVNQYIRQPAISTHIQTPTPAAAILQQSVGARKVHLLSRSQALPQQNILPMVATQHAQPMVAQPMVPTQHATQQPMIPPQQRAQPTVYHCSLSGARGFTVSMAPQIVPQNMSSQTQHHKLSPRKISPLKLKLGHALAGDPSKYYSIKPGLGGGSNKLYDKMKKLLTKKNQVSAKKRYYKRKKSPAPMEVQVEKMVDDSGAPVVNWRYTTGQTADILRLRRKEHGYIKKSPAKRGRPKKQNGVHGRMKRLQIPPHVPEKSHPMIHSQKETMSLPAAAVEEEVTEVPLSSLEGEPGTGAENLAQQNLGHLEYEITSDDGFTCRSDTIDGAWKQVTEKLQDARTAGRLKHLSYAGLSGVQMFGLSHPHIVYLVEQLYGASYCRRYTFKYHKHDLVEREIELLNPTGCIRTEPFNGRNPWDMFSFLMSRYRHIPSLADGRDDDEMLQKSARRATASDLPMAMRFRKLKYYSKQCVGVYRSAIHGRGLFCKRSIDVGEMIIEYAGEVIRNALTDLREKYYESKGIGCYMFRVDDSDVVDATMKGSAARFINHSCDPNCYSKVITVDNRKHIVIFALRKILRGEELTYDYKFPIEEIKIPCTCGARRCRKYLN